jgi:hypothetical protein
METVMIRLKNDKVRKLLQHLEELEILEVMDGTFIDTKNEASKISDLKNRILSPMTEDAIDAQLKKMRHNGQRTE